MFAKRACNICSDMLTLRHIWAYNTYIKMDNILLKERSYGRKQSKIYRD